jgi:hypothetical protein
MRFLESGKMLCLLPADHQEEQQALERANILWHAGNGWDKDRLPELTQSGFLRTASIHDAGKPVAVVWYRVERERLIVDTMIALSKGRSTAEAWNTLWGGISEIGRSYGCSTVEGVTARAALAKVYLDNGFEARGLVMRKEIS